MKTQKILGMLFLILAIPTIGLALPAFPGAEGGGSLSVGGRNGSVCQVTNLNDSGPGSLRACIDRSGARTVVFRVGGTINLKSTLMIKKPYITIAGQTAPGQGIQINGKEISQCGSVFRINTHDVVVRYLSIRKGACEPPQPGVPDALAIDYTGNTISNNMPNNIIIDHVSAFWAHDENMEAWGGSQPNIQPKQAPNKITFQYNILAEALMGHSTGFLSGSNDREVADSMKDIDLHKNIFAHNGHRNPLLKNGRSRVINNIIYNWSYYATQLGPGIEADVINNLYKHPCAAETNSKRRAEVQVFRYNPIFCNHSGYIQRDPSIYADGNQGPFHSNDNWNMVKLVQCENGEILETLPLQYRRASALAPVGVPITVLPLEDLEKHLLPIVGDSQRLDCMGNWVFKRDSQDTRIVAQVQTNQDPGFCKCKSYNYKQFGVNEENEVGGFPEIDGGAPCQDFDKDGMPDHWERAMMLDPKNPNDRNTLHSCGYTMLEMYLNGHSSTFDGL